jgi:hypothetical protein
MSSQSADPPIIVSGGSVTIRIPVGIFPGLLGGGDFTNPQKQIKRVEITGSGIPNYDQSANGSDITIKIEYGNPNP